MSFIISVLKDILSVLLSILTAVLFPLSWTVDSLTTCVRKKSADYPEVTTVMKEKYVAPECDVKKDDLFISPDGDDSAEGTINSPLKTFDEVKERLNSIGGNDCVTVWVRGGTYSFDDTLVFDENDRDNVTFRAYNSEKVVFTSGNPITGFAECEVNGIKAFKKNVGKGADFNILFNGETTLNRTRYPESGYFYVKETDSDSIVINGHDHYHDAYIGTITAEGDLRDFYNIDDVMIRILHYWKDEMLTIKSFDEGTNRVIFSRPTSMEVLEGQKYFLENVFEALNEPGEWYLDKKEGELYYVPFEGESPDNLTLWASETETMIDIDSVSGIRFEDITFTGNGFNIPNNNTERDGWSQAAYDATPCVSVKNSSDFSVVHCEFKNIAACAVFMGSGVRDSEVKSCRFENLGAQAVYIRGENLPVDDERTNINITVTDNHIEKYGRVFYNAVAILVIHANSVDISNNEIHDGYYTAISVGWVWGFGYSVTYNNKICNNLIYDIGQGWLSDMGGIYTLGIQPGTVISGNVIHNVAADLDQGGYGGWGIYLDEGSSDILVTENLVYDCGSQGFHQHYGENNTVTNNIFALNRMGQVRVSRKEGRVEIILTNNIIYSDKQPLYTNVSQGKFVDGNNLYWDETFKSSALSSQNESMNLLKLLTPNVMKLNGYMKDGVFADPLFKDAKGFDFTLPNESKALDSIGFNRFDYSLAGTITEF